MNASDVSPRRRAMGRLRPRLALGLALFAGWALWPPAAERAELDAPDGELAARPFDQPDRAAAFYRAKRLGGSGLTDARGAYRAARERLERMPLYSSRRGELLRRPLTARGARAPRDLDAWTFLGPGNVGGRTRALAIHPRKPRIMYAGGVSGGVWKTTSNGKRWRPVADDLANIAVNALALDPAAPEVLYAGTGEGFFREEVRGTALPLRGGGIFRSEDAGETWALLESTASPDFHWVNDLAVSRLDGARLYAATRRGVFRSLDRGATWRRVLKTRARGGCLDLALRTDVDTDYLLAACGTLAEAAVYRKVAAEGRGGWEIALAEGPAMGRTSLAFAPSDQSVVYALSASNEPGPGGRFEQALHAVFRSDRGGAPGSWRATVRNSDPRKINTLLLTNPIIASLEECGFEGPNEYLAMGWYVNTIAVDPRDPDRVWAAGVDLFRSDDGGVNWNPVTYWWVGRFGPDYLHADQHALVFHPRRKGTAFSLNDGGIARTRNAAALVPGGARGVCSPGSARVDWQSLNNGYGVTQFYHGTVYPDGRSYIAGAQDNGTVGGGDDRGANDWRTLFGGDGGYSAVDPRNPRVIYVTFQNGQIRKSVNGGITFDEAVVGITDLDDNDTSSFRAFGEHFLFISPLVMDLNDPDRLWSGGARLWRTDNAAATWAAASARLEGGGKASAIGIADGDSDLVIAGSDTGHIYRSESATSAGGGSVWESSRPRSGFVSSIAFDPADSSTVYATYAGFGGRHVWRSRDAGRSWSALDGGGPRGVPDIPVHSLVVDPADSRRLYLGTDLGVLVSLDGGDSWAVENTGFATAVTEWLTVNSDRGAGAWLFAFTHGRGAWRVELPQPERRSR